MEHWKTRLGFLSMLQGDEEEQLLVLVEGQLQVDVEVAFLEMDDG